MPQVILCEGLVNRGDGANLFVEPDANAPLIMRLPGVPDRAGYFVGYVGIRFVCLLVMLAAVWALGKRYVSHQAALAGALLLAVVVPLTHYRYVYQPSSVMEWAALMIALSAA